MPKKFEKSSKTNRKDEVQATSSSSSTAALAQPSLYVGDLEANVSETQLFELFNQIGHVESVRVCRDFRTRRSLGYGYVNYNHFQDAFRAMEMLNYTPLNGKSIRIMYSNRDPRLRRSGAGNVFIKNLDKGIDPKALQETFMSFGNVVSCKVATDVNGNSKGYGFVQYDNEKSAQNAIEKFNGMLMNEKQVYVGPFLRKQNRESAAIDQDKFNNVFVKNISEKRTEEDLKTIFGEYGEINSVVVMRDGDGKSKCFGFVTFENPDDAANAVEALNGKKFEDKEWFVGKAQKPSEREVELKQRFEQTMKDAAEKSQGANLYIKNLDNTITDEKLKELFSSFGTITSCKVMRDPNGISRGSGFVAFSTTEESMRALGELNGKMVVSKPLYVAHAQRKEDRRARLKAQFSQMSSAPIATNEVPGMPMYPPVGAMGQQILRSASAGDHSHAGSIMLPAAARPMDAPRCSGTAYFCCAHGPIRAEAGGGQHGVVAMMQGRGFHYIHEWGTGEMMPLAYESKAAAVLLAHATVEQQRTMLGRNLYPLVEQLEPYAAPMVTGLLLELDQREVLHLLDSPEALTAKVDQAIIFLGSVQHQNYAVDQMASLSL